jgi:chemotaxis receptor (MCP) glutamine deamidase CheD
MTDEQFVINGMKKSKYPATAVKAMIESLREQGSEVNFTVDQLIEMFTFLSEKE